MHVIKVGGAVCTRPDTLEAILRMERPLIIVHGGGPQLDTVLADLQEPQKRINGLRVTSPRAAQAVAQTLDDVGKHLVERLQARGVESVHVPSTAGLFQAVPKSEALGRVGSVTSFEAESLPDAPVVVVTPVGHDARGPLNVNADEGALAVATALRASKLILATDVDGVRGSTGKQVPLLLPVEAEMLIARGIAAGGMRVKLENALEALRTGIDQVSIGTLGGLQTRIVAKPAIAA